MAINTLMHRGVNVVDATSLYVSMNSSRCSPGSYHFQHTEQVEMAWSGYLQACGEALKVGFLPGAWKEIANGHGLLEEVAKVTEGDGPVIAVPETVRRNDPMDVMKVVDEEEQVAAIDKILATGAASRPLSVAEIVDLMAKKKDLQGKRIAERRGKEQSQVVTTPEGVVLKSQALIAREMQRREDEAELQAQEEMRARIGIGVVFNDDDADRGVELTATELDRCVSNSVPRVQLPLASGQMDVQCVEGELEEIMVQEDGKNVHEQEDDPAPPLRK